MRDRATVSLGPSPKLRQHKILNKTTTLYYPGLDLRKDLSFFKAQQGFFGIAITKPSKSSENSKPKGPGPKILTTRFKTELMVEQLKILKAQKLWARSSSSARCLRPISIFCCCCFYIFLLLWMQKRSIFLREKMFETKPRYWKIWLRETDQHGLSLFSDRNR